MEKKEEQGKTAGNLMTQTIKNLNAEVARTEEPAKTEENLNKDSYKKTRTRSLHNFANFDW